MHAYMILAHNEFELLENLIKALDDSRNDIFIHIDSKVRNFDFAYFKKIAQDSSVFFTPRVSVKWGDFSMVRAEYVLLEAVFSTGKNYDYVHLISGVDIPLMAQTEMHCFFEENQGKEFLHFGGENPQPIELDRVRYYHFATGRRNYLNRFVTKAESFIGKAMRINRIKGLQVQRGSQWFSITGDFAQYLLEQKNFVFKQFSHTFIPDEFFVQTVLINSPFKDNLYHKVFDNSVQGTLRYTDWNRGHPYTFTTEDYDELIHSDCLFARKFSSTVDSNIIRLLYDRVLL